MTYNTVMERELSFDPAEVGKLFKPEGTSKNGQITIIGGSELFHGAPLLSLTVASRIVDIVFFSSPDPSIGKVASNLRSKLFSFIWVPWEETDAYIKKSDAILIGPGFMRFRRESDPNIENDDAWLRTREITQRLLEKYKDKKWVIDAGSLQVLEKDWIPNGAILTPNVKEYKSLFGDMEPTEASDKYNCTIMLKGVIDRVCSAGACVNVVGGNVGMAKGGTGDTLAGLTAALFAKNKAELAASCASYITKKSGDELFEKVRTNFNADDLAQKVPEVLGRLQK
jgi:NAD(P)H-hydrate epimerase